jgi:hypothetical protein
MQITTLARGARVWSRTAVVLAATAAALVAVVLVAQGPASAHDHQPPKTVLVKGNKTLQSGRLVAEYIWSYPSRNGNSCITDEAVVPFGFPREVPTVAAGRTLKIRINTGHKLDSFYLHEVDRGGEPRGEVPVVLQPVIRDEKTVAWDAVFSVDRPKSVYRLVAEGHWQDQNCSDPGPIDPHQFAHWSFKVRTGSAS